MRAPAFRGDEAFSVFEREFDFKGKYEPLGGTCSSEEIFAINEQSRVIGKRFTIYDDSCGSGRGASVISRHAGGGDVGP